MEVSLYHKYKDCQDNWRRRNQEKINEYYRKKRAETEQIREDLKRKNIALEYIAEQLKKNEFCG